MPICNDASVTARRAHKKGDHQVAALKSRFLKIKLIFPRYCIKYITRFILKPKSASEIGHEKYIEVLNNVTKLGSLT
jgi:hypothetical protein